MKDCFGQLGMQRLMEIGGGGEGECDDPEPPGGSSGKDEWSSGKGEVAQGNWDSGMNEGAPAASPELGGEEIKSDYSTPPETGPQL